MIPPGPALERHRAAVRARLSRADTRRSGPDSVTWKINRDIVVIAGWGRAILLQLAHPLVGAGVHHHSSFRGGLLHSLRRLQSTVGAMLSLTFGNEEDAITAAAGINVIHDRVNGRLDDAAGSFHAGAAYSAHDPELLRWVHATLLESIPLTYELLVAPLTREDRDRYCAEAAVIEPLLGIPPGRLPRTSADLDEYIRAMIHDKIVVTDTSRALARAVLYPPRWQLLWPAFRPMQLITVGLLPPQIRTAYGFRWDARDARAFRRWTATVRRLHHAAPRLTREWPMARRREAQMARARLAGGGPKSARSAS